MWFNSQTILSTQVWKSSNVKIVERFLVIGVTVADMWRNFILGKDKFPVKIVEKTLKISAMLKHIIWIVLNRE